MTPQNALNIAVNGIRAQGALARRAEQTPLRPACAYYDDTNGNRCVIGHLLDIEEAKCWESFGAKGISSAHSYGLSVDLELSLDFLVDLQAAHDGATDVNDFFDNAKFLADRYNLEFPNAQLV